MDPKGWGSGCPCEDIPSHGCHSHLSPWGHPVPSHVGMVPPQHTVWGSPTPGPAAPVQAAAPAATPRLLRNSRRGGWRHPAPAARHLNLGASGGCHHVCRRMGGSSTAAAGMWPWHPRVGGAGSSPGMIPALGTGGMAGVCADPPNQHVPFLHAPPQCHLPGSAVAPGTGDNCCNTHPHGPKGGDRVGWGLWGGRTPGAGCAG